MASTAVSVGGQAGPAVPAGSRRFRPTLSTTPGRLRLLLIVGVLLSLAWGALAGFTASRYATAASSVVTTREPLSLDAQQIYSRLSDANDAAATAFLTGGLEPPAVRQASGLMRSTLLPAASGMDAAENASLGATSAQATGLPLISVTLAVGLVIAYLLYRTSRWLRRRTNRVLNVGLVAAGVALIVSVSWLAAAYTASRGDMLTAQARGSTPVE